MRVPKTFLIAVLSALIAGGAAWAWTSHSAAPGPSRAGGVHAALLGGRGAGVPYDTYPARWGNIPQDSVYDDWRELNRECTSFAAWMLHSVNGYDMVWYDDATKWASRAPGLVDKNPAVGSIGWRSSGHVAWVESVEGDQVTVQDYNHDRHHPGTWSRYTVPAGHFDGYIHFKDIIPPATPAPGPVHAAAAPAPPPVTVTVKAQSGPLQGAAGSANLQGSGPSSALQGSSGSSLQGISPNLQGPAIGRGSGSSTLAPAASPAQAPRSSTPSPGPKATTPDPTPPAQPPPPAPQTYAEQSGSHGSPTFTDPYNASGSGPRVDAMATVQVLCRVHAPAIASAHPDGWWYRIATAPWNGSYYAVANTFWNGDVPGQTPYTHNTDWGVPVC